MIFRLFLRPLCALYYYTEIVAVEEDDMKYRAFFILIVSCLVFTACKPKPTEETLQPASPVPSPQAAVQLPEAVQLQQDICGKLPIAIVRQLTGNAVNVPAITTVNSNAGNKRHICSYTREGDSKTVVLSATVMFKKENSDDIYKQTWESRKRDTQKIEGIGPESYQGTSGDQPVMYVLTDTAQYTLKMGKLNQSATQQADMLKQVAQSVAK
jgi:hypothetical protein